MTVANPNQYLLLLTERGFGKRTAVSQFRTTGRNVQGVIALKINDKTGVLAAAVVVGKNEEEVMVGSAKAMVFRTRIEEIRMLSRATQGVMVMTKLREGDKVISLSAFRERLPEEIPQLPRLTASRPAAPRQNGHKNGNGAVAQQLTLGVDVAEPEENGVEEPDADSDGPAEDGTKG